MVQAGSTAEAPVFPSWHDRCLCNAFCSPSQPHLGNVELELKKKKILSILQFCSMYLFIASISFTWKNELRSQCNPFQKEHQGSTNTWLVLGLRDSPREDGQPPDKQHLRRGSRVLAAQVHPSRLGRALVKLNHNTAISVFISCNVEVPVLIPVLKHSAFTKYKSVTLNYYISNTKPHRLIKSLYMYK